MEKKSLANVGRMHQKRIKRKATKNPMEAYFLGGFDLLPKATQTRIVRELGKMSKKK